MEGFSVRSRLVQIVIAASFVLGSTTAVSTLARQQIDLSVCFTPGRDCTQQIVDEIDGAKRELLVQAYSFTSIPIITAIIRAKKRGVVVRVILDKSNHTGRYSGATYLVHHGINPLIDYRVSIAHNKVVIIDGQTVITGSFNFTKAAQERNAENVLVIHHNPAIAGKYRENWIQRAAVSEPFGARPE